MKRFAQNEFELLFEHRDLPLILRAAQRTSQKRYGRLMVLFPPGTAKTTYASVVFPSHYLGEKEGRRLLLTS